MSLRSWFGSSRRWFVEVLARGEDPAHDPAEPVELITVRAPAGQVLLRELTAHVIEATGVEAFDAVTRSLTDCRLLVPRSQLMKAQRVVASRL